MEGLIFFITAFFIFFILGVVVCESLCNLPTSPTERDEIDRLIRDHEETMRRQYARNSDSNKGYKRDHSDDLKQRLIRNGLYETYLKMYSV